jgi:bacillithiol biosynthesis deacetylase BshB1
MEPVDILVFGAHPDDAEIGMAATIAKHTRAGRKVAVCDLTRAEMSSNGTVENRLKEAEEASRAIGLTARTNLALPDRGLFVCREHIDPIVSEIRKFRPRLVFAPYWHDRHPDHVACSHLVQEAVFNAKLRNYKPLGDEADLPAVTVEQLFFYYINDMDDPRLVVDVTDVYEAKRKALGAYRSQFAPAQAGIDYVPTPLTQGYVERVEARDRLLGQKHLIGLAEGFTSKIPYRVNLF